MSKSLGNIIDPDALADKYGPEALRYYLMSDIATGRDADFSEERLIQRYNTDLANSLGNLLNRSLNMAAKYRNGKVSSEPLPSMTAQTVVRVGSPAVESGADITIRNDEWQAAGGKVDLAERKQRIVGETQSFAAAMETANTQAALFASNEIARFCNELVDRAAPWSLAKNEKNGEELAGKRLDAVLYHLAESLRIIAILIYPVLPRAAHGIFDQLSWKMNESGRSQRFHLDDAKWGGLPDGHVLGKPTPLFPRIETPPVP